MERKLQNYTLFISLENHHGLQIILKTTHIKEPKAMFEMLFLQVNRKRFLLKTNRKNRKTYKP